MATSLYYGDNGTHAFWESADNQFVFIRNHGEQFWQALRIEGEFPGIKGGKSLRTLVRRVESQTARRLVFDTSQYWLSTRKNQRQMKLYPTPQPQY